METGTWLQISDREWHAGEYIIKKTLPWNRYELFREKYIGRRLELRALGTFGRLDEAQEHSGKLENEK